MATRIVKMEIAPGGEITIKGVTDENGETLDQVKCRESALKFGASFGELKEGSERLLDVTEQHQSVGVDAG